MSSELELERQTSYDNWRTLWTAHERREQTPTALIAAIHDATAQVTRERR